MIAVNNFNVPISPGSQSSAGGSWQDFLNTVIGGATELIQNQITPGAGTPDFVGPIYNPQAQAAAQAAAGAGSMGLFLLLAVVLFVVMD